MQEVNVIAVANRAVERRRDEQVMFLVVGSRAKEQPNRLPSEPSSVSSPIVTVPTTSSWDWNCVAVAETGGDWTAHGSAYSSALGVMNEAVRENATPDVAARILSGTASRQEQIDMAQRIYDRFGPTAWGTLTVEKCA